MFYLLVWYSLKDVPIAWPVTETKKKKKPPRFSFRIFSLSLSHHVNELMLHFNLLTCRTESIWYSHCNWGSALSCTPWPNGKGKERNQYCICFLGDHCLLITRTGTSRAGIMGLLLSETRQSLKSKLSHFISS